MRSGIKSSFASEFRATFSFTKEQGSRKIPVTVKVFGHVTLYVIVNCDNNTLRSAEPRIFKFLTGSTKPLLKTLPAIKRGSKLYSQWQTMYA